VPVEELFLAKFAKIKLRQECLISDLLKSEGIFYPQYFSFLDEKRVFQQAQAIAQVCAFCSPNSGF
jgi:hypothetical protein